jgi:hypothetical protein
MDGAARRIADGALAALAIGLEALACAALVAAVVYFLPSRFSVLVLSLYGFICVWLLQIAAGLILAMAAARAVFSENSGGDSGKAARLSIGFLITVALCNSYLLALGHLWGKGFGTTVDSIRLSRFLTFDQHMIDIVMAVIAILVDSLDHAAIALLHLHQPPLAALFSASTPWFAKLLPGDPLTHTGVIGLLFGLALSVWRWMARG